MGSDSVSESNDEGSDDPGYYGGSIREWKSSSSSKRNKKKNKSEERRLAEQRRTERRAERTQRKERKIAKVARKQKRITEEVPALIELTKKVMSLDYQPEQKFDLKTLEEEVDANDVNARSRLSSVLTIFRGFRIVKREKASHDKYIWIGRDDEEIERVLKSTLESNVETEDPLWNICSEVLRALMAARKASRVFLPIVNEGFANNESRRLTIAASILEGMGMAEKFTDELGGFVFKGSTKTYEEFKETLWDKYGSEFGLKKVQMNLTHVEVKEEHRYPIKPPAFDFKAIYTKKKEIPVVPEELKDDQDIQRAIANLDIVCRCGSMKELKGNQRIIKREGQKSHIRKQVLVGGKKKSRCKKCTGCLAPNCKKCKFCMFPHLKKPCENRVCLFPVVPKCPCFI